jgi:hypothetical protein
MDELLKAVAEKTGLPVDKAQGAIDAVLGFIKDKLPGPIASQIDKLIGGGDESGGGMMDKLGSMLGKKDG